MKILINYANEHFKESQKGNSKSGLEKGGFNKVIEYSPQDIDEKFYEKNKKILRAIRGGGYWLWKPYIILKALKSKDIKTREYIFYCDSGCRFLSSISPIIKKLNDFKQDILAVNIGCIEKHWTKRDVFIEFNLDNPQHTDSSQIAATNILVRKTKFSISFFEELLKYSQRKHLIDDSPSKNKNYKGFIENRHDQSIFSLLYKKHHLKPINTNQDLCRIITDTKIHSRSLKNQIVYELAMIFSSRQLFIKRIMGFFYTVFRKKMIKVFYMIFNFLSKKFFIRENK